MSSAEKTMKFNKLTVWHDNMRCTEALLADGRRITVWETRSRQMLSPAFRGTSRATFFVSSFSMTTHRDGDYLGAVELKARNMRAAKIETFEIV